MKAQYDFSKGKRGRFYRAGATFRLPLYLDAKVEHRLAAEARRKGVELSDLVNDLLKRDIAILESVK
jgi:hypothetical protein